MLRDELKTLVESAIAELTRRNELPAEARTLPVEISDTKSPEHGDFACNFALIGSKKLGMPPRKIAEAIQKQLTGELLVSHIEIAGPGFLNLRLEAKAISRYVGLVRSAGSSYARTKLGRGEKLNIEFVSVNPNGPITIGSGRGAAYGDALSRVLASAGYDVFREYYINDGVNSEQMRLFAESVWHYFSLAQGPEHPMPERGYQGEYVKQVAEVLVNAAKSENIEPDYQWFRLKAQEMMIARQRTDLESFRTVFNNWFSEQSLHDSGAVNRALGILAENGNSYRAVKPESEVNGEAVTEGEAGEEEEDAGVGEALWLRSTAFGDDKDRVLVRADGRPAYISADIAYLQNKFDRGFQKLKLILGPDHHGYIGRLYAACQASGHTTGHDGEFEIVIYQIVRFMKDGKPAPMRKRDGNIYELRDLIAELGATAAPNAAPDDQTRIGADAARFFFLRRSHDTHMDFDIDLATKQTDENPVFYVQYAHARVCSVLAKAASAGLSAEGADTAYLVNGLELALIRKILDLPFEVNRCSVDFGVHRLTTYAFELARSYHHFYDACRVIQPEDLELSKARLALCEATKIGLSTALDLLGVTAPERMERAEASQ